MMSAKRFERTNGHQPTTERNGSAWRASCECRCDGSKGVLTGVGGSESAALSDLLHLVYKHHGFIVCTEAGWKCSKCGRVKALQIHHRIARSKGRSDSISNLVPLCFPCHEQETNPK